ncbi:hypothetical protein ACRAWC_23800 [Leifsonia sp. L25]|uniref:hypothetical protein n=1 Tax=Leifsonia sp. L25 TaxID=3423957 RepID=UPI003D69A101
MSPSAVPSAWSWACCSGRAAPPPLAAPGDPPTRTARGSRTSGPLWLTGWASATAWRSPGRRRRGRLPASRRLDDALRTYLAERGAKRRPLAEVSASVTGVAGVRLASDAIVELWGGQPAADRHTAEARARWMTH